MYYYGFFRSLDFSEDEKGQLFKVVIETKNGDGVGEELIFTDSPFNIEYSTEDNDLFKPYKCSTATIGLLQKDMNFDFNTTSGNDVLVKLLQFDNEETEDDLTLEESDKTHFTVEWIGFATPNAYSQSYENYFDEFELECQDALSTLQYYKYETLGDKPTFVSFSDIIKKWCVFLGTYAKIYVTDTIVIPTTDFEDVLHTIYVDERNFFDEDGEPMTVLEVWEEICKYLSITCIPFKDTLYFVNYSAIKDGQNDYYEIKDVADYDAEIEYLQSSGSQYINLPLTVNVGQSFSIEGEMMSVPNSITAQTYSIFSANPYRQFESKFNTISSNHGHPIYDSTVGSISAYGAWGNGKDIGEMGNFYLGTDGRSTSADGTFAELSRPLTANINGFRLFGGYRNNSRYPIAFGKIKIKVDGNVVLDLIPIRKGNVGYFKDKISGNIYGNNGSGNFILGKDVKSQDFKLQIGKKVKLEHIHDILPNDFAANGTSLTLLPTYNKVSVKDDFYPFDSIIPNLKDSENMVETEVLDTIGYHPELFLAEVVGASNELTRIQVNFSSDKKYVVFIRYNGYENDDKDPKKLYTFWWDYNTSTQSVTANNTIYENRIFNYQTTCEHIGALPIQYQISEVEDFTDKINSISLKDALMVTFPLADISQIGGTYKQVLEWRSDNIALGKDNYIVISGNFTFFIARNSQLPYQFIDYDFYMDNNFSYQWAMLRCGTYWWDGEQWINNPSREVRFKLPIKYEYGKKAYGQSIPIANNISYDMRLDKEGYAVPIPFENVEIKNVGFTLFSPNRIDNDSDNTFDPSVEIITDFDIQIATKNRLQLIETKDNSNTEYVNLIPNGAVEEKGDTELKLTTWDFKSTNYSSLLYSENFYEDGFENALLNTFKRVRTIYNRGIGDIAFAEELIINNNVKQYSTPTTQLEVNLHSDLDFKPYSLLKYHFFDGKDFVVDGMSINVRENANTLKIVEKK